MGERKRWRRELQRKAEAREFDRNMGEG